MTQDEYVIINKTTLLKRIEELESKESDWFKRTFEDNFKINFLKEIISQSTPLIPEIEKSWEHGYTRGYNLACCEAVDSDCLTPNKQDYISNLKLGI